MTAIRRPVLRYHGGKWKLAPWIISHFPAHRIYTEAFGGGGSILLRKHRTYGEVYNDLDGEIVNLFRVLRGEQSRALLITALELTPFARDEFLQSYQPPACTDGFAQMVEQARRTVIRSQMGFGSAAASGHATGFRANSNRSGTTPAHDWTNYPKGLAAIGERLQGVVIENKDASAVIQQHDGPDTLHYVDPPYVFSTRKTGNPYCRKGYRFEMTDEQHADLAKVLHAQAGMIVLSGYDSDLYNDLYQDWRRETKASHADGAKDRTEVIWFNEQAWDRRCTQTLEIA